MANRRSSKTLGGGLEILAKIWRLRLVLLLVIPYLVLSGWLFTASRHADVRPGEVFMVPDHPLWEKPSEEHRFGTTGTGADLYELSRIAMANSVAVAVVSSGAGVALTLLVVMLFAFDVGENRFRLLKVTSRAGFLLPSFMVIVILAGGAGGSLVLAMIAMTLAIALALAPVTARWFEEGEEGPDILAGYALGLTRQEIVRSRIVPVVIRRLVGVFARMIPVLVMAEMSLSFLGFTGEHISVGVMVAYGRDLIIEAPWMALYPGMMATIVVAVLSLLGALAAGVLRTGRYPRFM